MTNLYENRQQLAIPRTSPETYITGIYSLNLPMYNKPAADWHPEVFYYEPTPYSNWDKIPKIRMAGEGQTLNTNNALRQWGVNEARILLIAAGLKVPDSLKHVYVANHSRAILDLLFLEITESDDPGIVSTACSEWLDEDEVQQTLEKAELLKPLVKHPQIVDKWIEHQKSTT